MLDEKQQNVWACQTMALDGRCINLTKKINAYLKKNNIGFDKTMEYLKQYNTEEFDEFIREQYEIKGDVTPVKIMSAKKKSEEKELTEHEEQVIVVKYCRENKLAHFAVPNGFVTDRGAAYINYLKSEGLKSGAPDLVVFLGKGKVLFIEMKRKRKYTQSEAQKSWQDYLENNGYKYCLAIGADEAIKFIKKESEETK